MAASHPALTAGVTSGLTPFHNNIRVAVHGRIFLVGQQHECAVRALLHDLLTDQRSHTQGLQGPTRDHLSDVTVVIGINTFPARMLFGALSH